ncbi:MAG: hypothetical protein LBC79_04915 [Deltaproteobacteria bacterium]|jgi:ribosome recycling factor|nr:hypothetical protein [Deltaproteobacteria bacterium]
MDADTKYRQLKISVDPGTASAFKKACAASNTSMAAEMTRFMAEYTNGQAKPKTAPDYSTRRRRRSAIKAIIRQLEQMKCREESVRDNMPDNLQGSSAYEAAEEAVSALEEAIDALDAFWMVP